MTRHIRLAIGACVVLFAAGGCARTDPPAPSPAAEAPKAEAANNTMPANPYLAEVTKFRQDREATLKGNAGWLTIAGLWFLTQPQATFGSDPLNDIVLPASAPPRAGTFEMRNGRVTVKAAEGVTFALDGKPVTQMELKGDVPGPADRLMLGNDLQFWVHNSGNRLSIRLRDQKSALRTQFTGLSWFPIDPAYKVEATYTAFDKPRMVDVASLVGDVDKTPIPGSVAFTLNGQEYKLEPFAEPGDEQFWFVFRDLTSQKETYPAARFLYAAAPVSGKMILDFNKAVNPPCAYNPYTTCPIPTEQNRLRTRIEAGEKYESKK
ncbi:MAG TPA: DUF1684 domain-containing protein [Vicinamibacterales bacterium]|nr:DUF1684 domain-containing protein [Vicinamibacterales bacterium]